ncbi:hypothetical protein BD414DRAFT_494584 [Trametes punicea]|nr:hypothetical protein BD414DRAFT_494584 [Trametes punicea]
MRAAMEAVMPGTWLGRARAWTGKVMQMETVLPIPTSPTVVSCAYRHQGYLSSTVREVIGLLGVNSVWATSSLG